MSRGGRRYTGGNTMMRDGKGRMYKANPYNTHGAPERLRTKSRKTKSLKVRANRQKSKAKARRR